MARVQIKSYQIPASISGVSSWISKCMELAAWRMTDSTWLSRSSADSFARADGAAPDGAAESWRQHGAGALSRYPLGNSQSLRTGKSPFFNREINYIMAISNNIC